MWSMGVIVYVLLSGLSPFMGDDDNETLMNVTAGEFDFDDEEEDDEDDEDEDEDDEDDDDDDGGGGGVFSTVSDLVKQFISELLVLDPAKRLTVDQALNHEWLKSEGADKK